MRILPIGSVVKLRNEKCKIMIVARMVYITIGEEKYYFDYAGCLYPSGLIGQKLANFNEEDIEEVFFEGFVNEDEDKELEIIDRWIQETDVKRADLNLIRQIAELKAQNEKDE